MRSLAQFIMFCGLVTLLPAVAQQAGNDNYGQPVTTYRLGSVLNTVPIYLRQVDGRWSASLTGDLRDPATEQVEISLSNGLAQVMTYPIPGGWRQCITKMKDRNKFGYLECNSAFYTANKGSAAAATLLRGVLSLGILTATDAAMGNTSFSVSIDQPALDAAISESKAIDLAKESLPLLEYRYLFASASTSKQLRTFIATFEGGFDPESLVAEARKKLPGAVAQEQERARQQAETAARQAEALRQQEMQRQADLVALAQFQRGLQSGDRVKMMRTRYVGSVGMIVELKPPLAYVQWENYAPRMEWVRLDSLLPPR